MTTIDKIRAEIERQKDYISVTHFAEDLLALLDTLEEPVSEDLEDCLELNEAAEEWVRPIMRTPEKAHDFLYTYLLDSFRKGAEWQKDKDTEAVIVAEDRGFLKGADWARAEMMEGAVEGKIEEASFNNGELHNTIFFSFNEESLHVENRIWFPRCGKEGDKVKIIIVKED